MEGYLRLTGCGADYFHRALLTHSLAFCQCAPARAGARLVAHQLKQAIYEKDLIVWRFVGRVRGSRQWDYSCLLRKSFFVQLSTSFCTSPGRHTLLSMLEKTLFLSHPVRDTRYTAARSRSRCSHCCGGDRRLRRERGMARCCMGVPQQRRIRQHARVNTSAQFAFDEQKPALEDAQARRRLTGIV